MRLLILFITFFVLFTTGCGDASKDANTDEVISQRVRTDYLLGDFSAPLLVEVFLDAECEFCRQFVQEYLPKLENDYIDKGLVAFRLRDFPLYPVNKKAYLAAKASYCAGDQGKYWEYVKAVYADDVLLTRDGFREMAEVVGVSRPDLFDLCLLADKYDLHLREQLREGAKLEISALPTVLVGEKRVDGLPKMEDFWALIEEQL